MICSTRIVSCTFRRIIPKKNRAGITNTGAKKFPDSGRPGSNVPVHRHSEDPMKQPDPPTGIFYCFQVISGQLTFWEVFPICNSSVAFHCFCKSPTGGYQNHLAVCSVFALRQQVGGNKFRNGCFIGIYSQFTGSCRHVDRNRLPAELFFLHASRTDFRVRIFYKLSELFLCRMPWQQ